MTKKLSQLSDLGGFVFSTNKDFVFTDDQEEQELLPASKQQLEAYLERKNRGGKTATVIKGFVGPAEELHQLAKWLKTRCGVGGSAKDGDIIIQGEFREKVIQLLQEKGYQVKRVGG